MRKPIAVMVNDIHIRHDNTEKVLRSFNHLIRHCVKNDINRVFGLGDIFDNRSNQRLACLETFDNMLKMCEENGIDFICFAGNHDKTRYDSELSFLKYFRFHPKFDYIETIENRVYEGKTITFMPFMEPEIQKKWIEDAPGGDLLLAHLEMYGSTHLGNVSKSETIRPEMFKKWKKVKLGHFHNAHDINGDIDHICSLFQKDYGEDNLKGFNVLYDDLSHEFVKGDFVEFEKITINIDETKPAAIKKLVEAAKKSDNVLRVELTGSETKLKTFKKSQMIEAGIDVKVKYEKKDIPKLEYPKADEQNREGGKRVFTKEDVYGDFKAFCERRDLDYNEGKKMLDEFMKKAENAENKRS